MNSANKRKYLNSITAKLAEARRHLQELEEARNNAPSAMESQHDTTRETMEKEAGAQNEVIKSLEQFKEILAKSNDKSQIEEGATFSANLSNGEKLQHIVFASINVGLPGVQIITSKSPIGMALAGKKVGESFSYEAGGNKITGVIEIVS